LSFALVFQVSFNPLAGGNGIALLTHQGELWGGVKLGNPILTDFSHCPSSLARRSFA
jgi:hypothetical protein